jgi:hypothetical protein
MTIFKGTTKAGQSKEVCYSGDDYEVWIDGKLHAKGYPLAITEALRKVVYAKAPREAVMAIKSALFTASESAIITSEMDRIRAEEKAAMESKLTANVPGLDILRAATDAHGDYSDGFARMMESEANDGVSPPKLPTSDLAAIRAQYPRAALWLRADCQANGASDDRKAAAGERARDMIESGVDLDAALRVLENWLPESARWS